MILQSFSNLIQQLLQSLASQPLFQSKTLHINVYIDRQLKHLVLTQQFDFGQITYLLGLMFPEHKHRITQKYCEQRWTQLHIHRKHKIDEKTRDNRKLVSVIALENPKRFESAREFMKEMEIEEEQRKGRWEKEEQEGEGKKEFEDIFQQQERIEQFNITKEKIKKISQEKYKQMQKEYIMALEKAKEISDDMYQKPFVYRPKFIVDNNYELERQDLTEEKAKEIVSSDIRLDSKVVGDFKDKNYESKFKVRNQGDGNGEKEEEQQEIEEEKEKEEMYNPRSKGIFAHLENEHHEEEGSDFEDDDEYY